MTSEAGIRSDLRAWIIRRSKSGIDRLDDDTPILESGILSSLDVVELIVFIESLRGEEVDVDDIEPEALTNVGTLYETFFGIGQD
ncbi:MAG: acyl carrier protein [Myxococcales bacterium]|nr:acyl carrier protein [Myxococcales bacterium]